MNRISLTLASTLTILCISVPQMSSAQDSQPITSASYVTRAEAAMIILSSIGTYIPNIRNEGLFPDLIDGQWYTKYMLAGLQKGMLGTRKHGLMQPHHPITRAEFLKMITVAFQLERNLPSTYTDIELNAWYLPYTGTAYRYGLFKTLDTKELLPNVLINHYEASYAIQTILNADPSIRKTILPPLRRALIKDGTVRSSAPMLTQTVSIVMEVVSTPPQEQIKFITAQIVKDAMVRMFQKNAVVASSTRQQILRRVNMERKQEGLYPLRESPLLSAAAAQHAEDMWKRKYFDHTTPEGITYVSRIRNTGYMKASDSQCRCVRYLRCTCTPVFALGENIAQGQFTVEQVMSDWMGSRPHRRNILSTDFDEIGIGLFGTNWVQTFGHVEFYELPEV